MYSVIQFNESDGGSVSVVHNKWLTPRRQEVYWPPIKEGKAFDRLLAQVDNSPDEKWKLYGIQRVFVETDCLEKAKKKLKLAEVTSDLQTETEEGREVEGYRPKRKALATKRYVSCDDDDDDPPLLKKHFSKYVEQIQKNKPNQYLEPESNINTELINSTSPETPTNINTFKLTEFKNSPGQKTPSSKCNKIQLTDFEEKVIQILANIKEQNEQIISYFKKDVVQVVAALKPNIKIPLETADDITEIEHFLENENNSTQLIRYLSTLGGRDVTTRTYRVLRCVMTDSLAVQYNFYGKRSTKRPFCDLKLRPVIIDSIKWSSPGSNNKEIEDCIKAWLKHAPERLKRHNKNE